MKNVVIFNFLSMPGLFTFILNFVVPPAASIVLSTALLTFLGKLIGPASQD